MSDEKYDLNIDNYSEEELCKLIKYKGDIQDLTPEYLQDHIGQIINKSKKKYNNNPQTIDHLTRFLTSVNDKLLSYVTVRPHVQYEPTNYNIIQSQNQLQGGNHNVITDKIIPVVNINENKYPTGVINPLEKKTITKVISIDSEFREDYAKTSSSNFVWNLPTTEHKVVSVKLISFELPVVWYSISEKNKSNTFNIETFNITGLPDTVHTIILPDGNYTATQFGTSLTNYMLNIGNGLQYLICEINPITGKTVIRARNNSVDSGDDIYDSTQTYYSPNFYFVINFGETIVHTCDTEKEFNVPWYNKNNIKYRQYSLGSFLGFNQRTYTVKRTDTYNDSISSFGNITYEAYLQSQASYSNGFLHYVFISVEDFNNNYIADTMITSTGENAIGDNILGRISIDESFSTVLYHKLFDPIFKQRDYMGPVNLNKFRIKILDKYGNVIDMNNNDISLSLEITILYS
jgi:hypothetical protein